MWIIIVDNRWVIFVIECRDWLSICCDYLFWYNRLFINIKEIIGDL